MQNIILTRLRSFLWRFGAYIVVAALAWLTNNIGLLELPPFYTALFALILGEISKWFNNRQQLRGRTFLGKVKLN